MAHILTAVQGSSVDVVPIRRALLSVSDKTGIVELATFLQQQYDVVLISTGGTAQTLRQAGLVVQDVSQVTGATECLNGRVKTLHPKIHGGLLAVRGNAEHKTEMEQQGMEFIDMTVVNLYPFEATVAKPGVTMDQCIENIDIGGPSMLRSTAKNHAFTTVVTSPSQYTILQDCMTQNAGGTTLALRRQFAAAAFALSAHYDSSIALYFSQQLGTFDASDVVVPRVYEPAYPLKYGCNPHQNPARILRRLGHDLPFEVLNGTPGYINLLDAANAWQLVHELKQATGLAAAASFKHVSPAGAAVAVPLSNTECQAYEITPKEAAALTPSALAYLRARNADPMCSFGDFCAVSDIVDQDTAHILKREVSDGIIAPGYTESALAMLKAKKGGKFIVLQAKIHYDAGELEYREVYGMTFCQKRNTVLMAAQHFQNIVTSNKDKALDEAAMRDLILASICIKYTQSNSVGFAKNGMMVGVGAGQQSRVDCVKLAGRKVATWYLRQHPKVLQLPFLPTGVKRQDRVNARVRYIEGDMTAQERVQWETQFSSIPEPLTEQEKVDFLKTATGLSLSSDAFFPFRDSIDHASQLGVQFIAQPGGSVQDDQVTAACNEYGMTMVFTNVRLFHH